MSEQQIKERARERLLAAELAEVLHVDAAAIEAADAEPERRRGGWLAAALLCLGVAVAGGVAWLRTEEARQAAQDAFDPTNPWWEDEVPFSVPKVWVRSPEEVAALPATTTRIVADNQEAKAGTIEAVLQRDDLRQFLLFNSPAPLPIPWTDIAARDSLRSLGFTSVSMPAEQLRQLGTLPALRALTLSRESVRIDATTVPVLAGFKTLQHLDISYDELDPEALQRLAELPALTSLVLGVARSGAGDLTAQLAAVAKIRTLRTLCFDGDSDPLMPADALRQLRGLPNLIALQLMRFQVDDAGLAALPRTLQQLQLPSLDTITPAGIAILAELGSLRSLGFHPGIPQEHDAAVRDLVQKLPLECFECLIGNPSDAMWSVLAGLPLLRRVRVLIGDEDFSTVYEHALACRKLEVLFLSVWKMPSPEQLTCLGTHPTLRRIVFRRLPTTPMPTAAELAALRAAVRAEIVID